MYDYYNHYVVFFLSLIVVLKHQPSVQHSKQNLELQLLLDDLQMHPWKYVQVNLIGRKQKSEFSKKDLIRLRDIIADELEGQEGGSSSND